ncbi:MAG: hypothetical protein KF901_25730 [Myxococcales bacterium]|nr:hypothetical protein [Myxococcales bacterium]
MTTENAEESIPPAGRFDLPAPTTEADAAFVAALRRAGVASELVDPLLAQLSALVPAKPDDDERRLDLLILYYEGNGDEESAFRRRKADRFFLHDAREHASARELVFRLAFLAPELGDVTLERIGSDDGPLVLRAGDHLSAVTDPEEEEELDTGEIDLSELEQSTSITVRGLVRALNVLLERHGVRERLVPLPCDGRREAYVALPLQEAMDLCRAGGLDEPSPERLLELAAW